MLKKVTVTNVHTGTSFQAVVDTDTHEKALIGAGVSSSETAVIEDITGIDESVQRFTSPKDSPDDRVLFFNGLATCLERNIGLNKSLQLQANRVKTPKYRGVIAEMAYDLSIGEKFSDAASKHPVVFPMEILSLLIAGEEAGHHEYDDTARDQAAAGRALHFGRLLRVGLYGCGFAQWGTFS